MADITPIASLNGELAMPEKVWMQGPPGPQGQQGEPGAAATVTVGTVTTGEPGTDAIVTNSGTESAAVLNFAIPKGETGAVGAVGPQGPRGDKGDPGPAGAGVPDGGTVGQLLGKTETGTAWIDPPQSGGGGNVPKPLTYDYMPEGYPIKSGFDIEWDGNTDGLTYITYIKNYKVSDITPTNDELIGATLGISNGKNLTLTSNFIYVASEDVTVVLAGDVFVSIARKDNAVASGIIDRDILFPQKGTYFVKGDKAYVTGLRKQTITPMAEEFLPSEVNEFIMNSSTPDSTKKFKITVDDSGTISATEVT